MTSSSTTPDSRGRFGRLRRPVRPRDGDGRPDELSAGTPTPAPTRPLPPSSSACPRLRRPPLPALPGRATCRARRRRAHLPQARGPEPHRRAQDQQRRRPGAACRAPGQAPDRRRDRRRPARRGVGHRLRRFGLDCHVFMGEEDIRRQRPTSFGMGMLGAEVIPVTSGTGTLKDAMNEAIRDWITNVETTHYLIGSAAGPHPYPMLVRDLQSVIGREARAQSGARGPPARRRRGLRGRRLERHRPLSPLPRRPRRAAGRRRGRRATGPTGARRHAQPRRVSACCTARRSYVLADEDGQVLDSHSISAGLDYPGVGPEHSCLKDSGRADLRAGHRRRGARRVPPPVPAGGDHPGAGVGPRAGTGACARPGPAS